MTEAVERKMTMQVQAKNRQPSTARTMARFGRPLLSLLLIGSLATGICEAKPKAKKAEKKPAAAEVARANNTDADAQAKPNEEAKIAKVVKQESTSANKNKNYEIVTASKTVVINGYTYQFLLKTRDDWDYVLGQLKAEDIASFHRFGLKNTIKNLVGFKNRKFVLCNNSSDNWLLQGEGKTYGYVIAIRRGNEVETLTVNLGVPVEPNEERGVTWDTFCNDKMQYETRFMLGGEVIAHLVRDGNGTLIAEYGELPCMPACK